MAFARMIALSLFAGFVAGGFVWYGWALARNLSAIRKNRTADAAKGKEDEEAQKEREQMGLG